MKLRAENVSKRYGPVDALKQTSLEVADGEFLSLLGPSGSGKTTLLTIIAGLAQPSSGEVYIDGKHATGDPPFKRDIGMVFQNYALFPHLSVAENVAFPLRMRRVADNEVRKSVQSMLELVSLPHVANRLPRELSGGQQQRVALARAMVYRPSIILMDEPLGALDKNLREQMQLEIKRLHKQLGVTIIYVTHDQEEALAMSDRVCLMNGGEIEQLATPIDIYSRPTTVFAAQFIGQSNVMNSGEVSDHMGAAVPIVAGHRIMVRPEYVRLGHPAPPDHHSTEAVFLEQINIGSTTRYFFQSKSKVTMSMLALNSDTAAALEIGQICNLVWPACNSVIVREVRV